MGDSKRKRERLQSPADVEALRTRMRELAEERAKEQRAAYHRRLEGIRTGVIIPGKEGSFITHLEAHDMMVKVANIAVNRFERHIKKTYWLVPRPVSWWEKLTAKVLHGWDTLSESVAVRRTPADGEEDRDAGATPRGHLLSGGPDRSDQVPGGGGTRGADDRAPLLGHTADGAEGDRERGEGRGGDPSCAPLDEQLGYHQAEQLGR